MSMDFWLRKSSMIAIQRQGWANSFADSAGLKREEASTTERSRETSEEKIEK